MKEWVFGVKRRSRPQLVIGDIVLLRQTDPGLRRNYGVKAVWLVENIVADDGKKRWDDGLCHWLIFCKKVLQLPGLMSEQFDTPPKVSERMLRYGIRLTAGKFNRSLTSHQPEEGRAYIFEVLREFGAHMTEAERAQLESLLH